LVWVTLTNVAPPSSSRRAIRQCRPKSCLAVEVRGLRRLLAHVKEVALLQSAGEAWS